MVFLAVGLLAPSRTHAPLPIALCDLVAWIAIPILVHQGLRDDR